MRELKDTNWNRCQWTVQRNIHSSSSYCFVQRLLVLWIHCMDTSCHII